MKLKIKLLKPFSDAVGKSELELDFDGITLEDMLKVLVNRYPQAEERILHEDRRVNRLYVHVCQ